MKKILFERNLGKDDVHLEQEKEGADEKLSGLEHNVTAAAVWLDENLHKPTYGLCFKGYCTVWISVNSYVVME